jgi:hypothetical protein
MMRKSCGGERARFLGVESEPRTKKVGSLAGGDHRADVSACPTRSLRSRIGDAYVVPCDFDIHRRL